jgi:hypothetical protein
MYDCRKERDMQVKSRKGTVREVHRKGRAGENII